MLINSSVLSSEATQDGCVNGVLPQEVTAPLYCRRSVNHATVLDSGLDSVTHGWAAGEAQSEAVRPVAPIGNIRDV